MTEQFRPQPETPKQHAPEAGAGPLGIPPPEQSQRHQERLADTARVRNLLERRASLVEIAKYPPGKKHSRENRAFYDDIREKRYELAHETAMLYVEGTNRERLILEVFGTLGRGATDESIDWRIGLSAKEIREFLDRVEPMSMGEISKELRKAQEAWERKSVRYKKMAQTQRNNRRLATEEREKDRRFRP